MKSQTLLPAPASKPWHLIIVQMSRGQIRDIVIPSGTNIQVLVEDLDADDLLSFTSEDL